MTISDGKIAGAVIAAVVILMCCFLKNSKSCRKRPRLQSEETPENESSLERNQAPDHFNGHIPLPGFGFGSTLPVKFCSHLFLWVFFFFEKSELTQNFWEYQSFCPILCEFDFHMRGFSL